MEELCDQMSTDPAALNVAIHRARRRLALTKVTGASDIIEVKRGMRRLTTDRIEIVSLSELRR